MTAEKWLYSQVVLLVDLDLVDLGLNLDMVDIAVDLAVDGQ